MVRPELDDTAAASPTPPRALDRTATQPSGSQPAAPGGAGLASGQQLGHFRVERRLGAGGMGEVYLATDLALDRPVAIKVLPDALARDATRRERLIREARAQARVVHPNVGHIYFIGEDAGHLFVAMEYVPGETLGQRIAAAPMSVDDALDAIRGAALGLREAHRAGFLHRDVKPSNLMLDSHGALKVLDFGLAAGGAAPEEAADLAGAGTVTQTSLAGTPLYMAPEQARGEPIDVRADIYALGATLYHLVSGQPPFQGNSADELRELHSSAPRPRVPSATAPRTAIAIGELCARMMAPRAADRVGSYDELIAAIDTLATSRARPAGFSPRVLATGFDFILCALVVTLVGGLLGLLMDTHADVSSTALFVGFGLYQIVCVRRWGRTAGKSLLELEVVRAASGERPSWGQAARRTAVLLLLPLVAAIVADAQDAAGYQNGIPHAVGIVVDIATVLVLAVASARAHGKRAIWDRIGGTLVRYRAVAPVSERAPRPSTSSASQASR